MRQSAKDRLIKKYSRRRAKPEETANDINQFIELLEAGIAEEFRSGYAYFVRDYEKPRVVKVISERRCICTYPQKPLSFSGTRKDGVSIVFDARFVRGPIIRQNLISPQRAETLQRHSELRALVFIIIGTEDGACYRVPWNVWCSMQTELGRRYLRQADITRFKIANFPHIEILA